MTDMAVLHNTILDRRGRVQMAGLYLAAMHGKTTLPSNLLQSKLHRPLSEFIDALLIYDDTSHASIAIKVRLLIIGKRKHDTYGFLSHVLQPALPLKNYASTSSTINYATP